MKDAKSKISTIKETIAAYMYQHTSDHRSHDPKVSTNPPDAAEREEYFTNSKGQVYIPKVGLVKECMVKMEILKMPSSVCTPSSSLHRQPEVDLGFPAQNIISSWKIKEVDQYLSLNYDMDLPYVSNRSTMVEWIMEVSESLDLQFKSVHSAVTLMDRIFSNNEYHSHNWILKGVCCITMAYKLEETVKDTPTIPEVSHATEMHLPSFAIAEMEFDLMRQLKWNAKCITSMHFLEFYLHSGICFTSDTFQGLPITSKVHRYLKRYSIFFSNLTLWEYNMLEYLMSVIAASSVYCARRALRVMPLWPKQLEMVCEMSYQDVKLCSARLWSLYKKYFPSHRAVRKVYIEDV